MTNYFVNPEDPNNNCPIAHIKASDLTDRDLQLLAEVLDIYLDNVDDDDVYFNGIDDPRAHREDVQNLLGRFLGVDLSDK